MMHNARVKGTGKLLVDAVVNWSVQNTMGRLRVNCNTNRPQSHLFYQSLGFSLNKEQKVFDISLNLN